MLRSGSLWELLTQSDSNGQKSLDSHYPRNSSSCTTCFISIPSFKEQKGSIYSIYMRKGKNDKKLVKKVQLDAGNEEGTGWGGLFRTEQNISQSVSSFLFVFYLKQHCAAVVERSFSASLTEWQSNATLWMKLCLISSWMQTSQIETHGEAKQTKRNKKNRKIPGSITEAGCPLIHPLTTIFSQVKFKTKMKEILGVRCDPTAFQRCLICRVI